MNSQNTASLDEFVKQSAETGERLLGRGAVDVMNLPVADPRFPVGEQLLHQRTVLSFFQGNGAIGLFEIGDAKRQRYSARLVTDTEPLAFGDRVARQRPAVN